jgi:hypothetical protein
MLDGTDHFAHRESAGIVVDLFWNQRALRDEFPVEVEDKRDRCRLVLRPATGRAAIQAFHHPFAPTPGEKRAASSGEQSALSWLPPARRPPDEASKGVTT